MNILANDQTMSQADGEQRAAPNNKRASIDGILKVCFFQAWGNLD